MHKILYTYIPSKSIFLFLLFPYLFAPRNKQTMYRTHDCVAIENQWCRKPGNPLRLGAKGAGFGRHDLLDLRDRFGITQVVFNMDENADLCQEARKLGREFVVQISGAVRKKQQNPNRATGDIEVEATTLKVLNASATPPFTIEDNTDGGDDLRMKYRYLDLRRTHYKTTSSSEASWPSSRASTSIVRVLWKWKPFLIKSTPEGARDFVVPSRMNPGEFYALPQSPQTFKQILMVAGLDKYFQIVKCFRDEDLRADRQPEFTQIDCEMSFVHIEDILNVFEDWPNTCLNTPSTSTWENFRACRTTKPCSDMAATNPICVLEWSLWNSTT